MAALSDAYVPELVDLNRLRPSDLDYLLEDEIRAWTNTFEWDFAPSAELVRRFLRTQSLHGYALIVGDRAVGYSYYVPEEGKALVGDLYLAADFASVAREDILLHAVVGAIARARIARRVEAQLLLLRGPAERPLPEARRGRVHLRQFLRLDLEGTAWRAATRARVPVQLRGWSPDRQEECAHLIASAYQAHIDSCINDQYKTVRGAQRFLTNIVQYPGCGTFEPSASLLAETPGGRLSGLVLASTVSESSGHITQICVAPDLQGSGVGRLLLGRSLEALQALGCRSVSLTVTSENRGALSLYQNLGFQSLRRFAAYVWEGMDRRW